MGHRGWQENREVMCMANPSEEATAHEQAMQWALEDLLTHQRLPTQETLAMIPLGEAIEIIKALGEALQEGGEIGARKSFIALCKVHSWLKDVKNKPIPPRLGIEAEKQESDPQADPRFTVGRTGKKVIVRFTEDDIDALSDIEYLIKDILQKGSVSMLYGPSGTGKTFNALNIAYCIAHGVHWFGHEVRQGKVWYINTEGGHGLKPRIAAWRKEYRRGKTSNIEFITWPVHLKEHSQELLDTIEDAEKRPSLLVIDNYSMCATGTNQNDQMEVTRTLMVLHEIAQTYGCHCLLVHHSNWTGKVNGSAAFRNHVDTMIDLSKPSKESPILLKCEKQRDAEGFLDIHLELKIVSPYAHPVTGEFITSCVVVQSDQPMQEELHPKQRQCLDLLANGMTLGDWQKLVEKHVGVSRRTLERFRDLFEEKGLIERRSNAGKYDTYYRKSGFNVFKVSEDE